MTLRMQKSVLSLVNIEGQYTYMHFKSDMTAVVLNISQVQFPYNLTKR